MVEQLVAVTEAEALQKVRRRQSRLSATDDEDVTGRVGVLCDGFVHIGDCGLGGQRRTRHLSSVPAGIWQGWVVSPA